MQQWLWKFAVVEITEPLEAEIQILVEKQGYLNLTLFWFFENVLKCVGLLKWTSFAFRIQRTATEGVS